MKRLCSSGIAAVLALTLTACERSTDRSMLIAPILQGAYYCEGAENDAKNLSDEEAAKYCARKHLTGAARIEAALGKIGPRVSPSGRYRLGYTLVVPLMRYFERRDDHWVLDRDALRNGLRTIAEVNREVVVYLSANHFTDSGVELSLELARDPGNLMSTRSGPMFPDSYFNHPVVAWNLSDPDAAITKLRLQVFQAAVEEMCLLPTEAQERIAAVSVLGEVHQIYPGFAEGPRYAVNVVDATDYSPAAIQGFRRWLLEHFKTIGALNNHLGAAFASFQDVVPPSKDMNQQATDNLFEHLDNYAVGTIPVYGWAHDKTARPLKILVRVDGQDVGEAETGLSRTDVTDAVPAIANPNIGFRYLLDFTKLSPGGHTLDVLVRAKRTDRLLARTTFLVGPTTATTSAVRPSNVIPMAADSSLVGHLDGPTEKRAVIFNPLAVLWLKYRSLTVTRYLEKFASLAQNSCIPKSKIFSHQITPSLTGSWNADLLAVDDSAKPNKLYNPGTTLYGGAAFGHAFLRMKKRLGWDLYGVSEMHPISLLSTQTYRSMFEMHRKNGAIFVAPYYAVITPNADLGGEGLGGFLLSERNPKVGSAAFYRAIVAAAREK